MKESEIYDTWNDFINDERYKKYFITEKEKWYIKLNK